MTSRELNLTISPANVQASLEQFLYATKCLTPGEDLTSFELTFNRKDKTFSLRGTAEKLDEVEVKLLN